MRTRKTKKKLRKIGIKTSTCDFNVFRLNAGVLALFCIVCVSLLQAQTAPVIPAPGEMQIPPNTRVLRGIVTDAHGAPITNAIVLLKDAKTLQVRSYLATTDGHYQFYGLSSDVNYEVRAETPDMISPTRQVSVFDSHRVIKLNLKIKNKKKSG